MAKSTFQHKLEELQQLLSELQQFSNENPGRVREFLPGVLAQLQRSLIDLQTIDAQLPANKHPSSNGNAAALGDGTQATGTLLASAAIERARAKQELAVYRDRVRSLMGDLLIAEERERRRLAIDLHDGLSQTIALAQIKIGALRSTIAPTSTGSLEEVSALIDQADRAARTIGSELSPLVLHDLGLEPAVHWLVENVQTRYGVAIDLQDDGQPKPTDEKTRVILFRAIRELLINAAKHARARKVHVCLRREADVLNAAVEDDGVGMELHELGARGFGLLSIHERLQYVGGSMRIDSTPGRGTKVQLIAPLANGKTNTRVEA